jgi:predicted outer membrane protein
MRITKLLLNSTMALSLPLLAQAQQPGAPAIPRAQPAAAPSGQQPGRVQPGQPQPGQPGLVQPGQPAQPGQPGQPGQPQATTVNKPVVGEQSQNQASKQVASLLAICNHKEVKLAELAKSKSESKDVQQFAEMMIKDHSEMLNKLNQFGGQSGLGASSSSHSGSSNQNTSNQTAAQDQNRSSDQNRTNDQNRTADQNRSTTSSTAAHSSAGGLDFVAVQRHAAQECLSKAEKHWSDHKGSDGDMAYIGSQLVAHEEMINQMTALRPHASPELQKEIDNGIESAKHHRDEAHKLIEKLSKNEKKS